MVDLRKNLIERRMVEVDPYIAEKYLQYNTYVSQRPVRNAHVADLAEKMKNGLFRFGEVGFALLHGDTFLINGQHVCNAILESKMTAPCILEKFQVKNDMELSETFRQFEILPRSLKDMVKVEASALKLQWPTWLSSLLVSAAALDRTENKGLTHGGGSGAVSMSYKGKGYLNKDQKVRLLKHYLKEGRFLDWLLTTDGKYKSRETIRHLQRTAVALIIIRSWRVSHEDSEIFWVRVRDGENLTKAMPEMKLREFLRQPRATMRPSAYAARNATNHEYAYRCIQAWNAFRTNAPTKLSYYPNNELPKMK